MDIKIQKIKSDVLFKTKSLTNAENLNSDEELIINVIKIRNLGNKKYFELR